MNWISILISGVIGAIAAVIGSAISNKIFKDSENKNTIKSIVMISIFAIITVFGNKLILPVVEKFENQSKIEEQLNKIQNDMPTFSFIKKHDPQGYNEMLQSMNDLYIKNKDKKPEEISQLFHNYGATLMNKYMKNTSPELLFKNMEALVDIMRELNEINPDTACRFLFPGIFGQLQNNTAVIEVMKKNKIFKIQEKIIIDSVNSKESYDAKEGSILFEKFKSDYAIKNSKYSSILNNLNNVKTPKEKKQLTNAIISFYDSLLSLEKGKVDKILRFLASNE